MSDFIGRRFTVNTTLQGAPVVVELWETEDDLVMEQASGERTPLESIRQLHGKIVGNGPFPLAQNWLIGTPELSALISVRSARGEVRSWGPYYIHEIPAEAPINSEGHDIIEADEPDVSSVDKQRMDELYEDLKVRWEALKRQIWSSTTEKIASLMLQVIDKKLAMELTVKQANPFGE